MSQAEQLVTLLSPLLESLIREDRVTVSLRKMLCGPME